MTSLWTPTTLGNINLPHRLALAPMTRNRANADGTPTSLVPIYYAQRASLGLLITEGTQPSEDGQGYMLTPGIHSDGAQIAAWKKVATAVHAEGGHIFMQIMHAGRIGHPDNTPHHRDLVAPSAISAGQQQRSRPRARSRRRRRARSAVTRCSRRSTTSARPPATRLRPAWTASRSMAPTAT